MYGPVVKKPNEHGGEELGPSISGRKAGDTGPNKGKRCEYWATDNEMEAKLGRLRSLEEREGTGEEGGMIEHSPTKKKARKKRSHPQFQKRRTEKSGSGPNTRERVRHKIGWVVQTEPRWGESVNPRKPAKRKNWRLERWRGALRPRLGRTVWFQPTGEAKTSQAPGTRIPLFGAKSKGKTVWQWGSWFTHTSDVQARWQILSKKHNEGGGEERFRKNEKKIDGLTKQGVFGGMV